MEIQGHATQGIMVVAVTGELDASNCQTLIHHADTLFENGHQSFVIDMTHVTFIDSAGLSALVRLHKRARSMAGTMWLAGIQPKVRRVLELTRLDRVFEIARDAEHAIQGFHKRL